MLENKICVYAICKNEIQFAKKWIDNMSEADYIVVLDTGSDDGTYEYLQSQKKKGRITDVKRKVIKPWRFDVARNESMKLVPANANILLCTDFDELLNPGWASVIKEHWTENTCRGQYQYAWSHAENGEPGLVFTYDKLHSNVGYTWLFPVHETLAREDGLMDLGNPDICYNYGDSVFLHHYPDLTKSRSNYLDLLKLRLEENPDNCYSYYLLGREYGLYNRVDDAIDILKKGLECRDLGYFSLVKYHTLYYLGNLYICKKDYETALNYFFKQLFLDNTYRDPYLQIAEIYNQIGQYASAYGTIQDCMAKTVRHYDWSESEGSWDYKCEDILSVSCYYLNLIDEGIKYAEHVLRYNPSNQRVKANYQALLQKKNENPHIEEVVTIDG